MYRLWHSRTVYEKLLKIPLFGPSFIHQLRLFGSQQHPQIGILWNSFSASGKENILADINLGLRGVIKDCNFFLVKNLQTLAALWAGALSCNKKKSREQNAAGQTTVLGMFKDYAIILDVIRWSFLTKSATSVQVEFGQPPLSSNSTSSLPSRNREYHLKRFYRFRASFP
jgi:hypothetical protein